MARTNPKDLFTFRIKRGSEGARAGTRSCEKPGCAEPATHRAPKSRSSLSDYRWFCLDHVREYNQHWDFFAGMPEDEIARFQRDAIVGHRPTWGMGKRHARNPEDAAKSPGWSHKIEDIFTILDDGPAGPKPQPRDIPKRKLSKLQEDCLATLGLDDTATLNDAKARYKELVKRYHPDANGGDRGAEDRLKQVIKAFSVLKSSGLR